LLRWGQIDFFKRTLTVGKSKTEGGSGRIRLARESMPHGLSSLGAQRGGLP